jgi:hypothetical protein
METKQIQIKHRNVSGFMKISSVIPELLANEIAMTAGNIFATFHCDPPNLLSNGYRGVKRPGGEANHSPRASAEVMKLLLYMVVC